jgi:hypothetical protein
MGIEENIDTPNEGTFPTPLIPIIIPQELPRRRVHPVRIWYILPIITLLRGLGSGYLPWSPKTADMTSMQPGSMRDQVNPKSGYQIRANYGSVGPQLVSAGVIDSDQFEKLYQQSGNPLTQEEMQILSTGGDRPVVITKQNAYF